MPLLVICTVLLHLYIAYVLQQLGHRLAQSCDPSFDPEGKRRKNGDLQGWIKGFSKTSDKSENSLVVFFNHVFNANFSNLSQLSTTFLDQDPRP